VDEVASALDAESEELIQKSIESLKGKCTIFAVAHRLSTIRNADRIFVLENGEIVESGTHRELMNKNGRFRQLYDMQFHADKWPGRASMHFLSLYYRKTEV
jgi:ABC-type multidrug transport system fused ATPase/permease subunit